MQVFKYQPKFFKYFSNTRHHASNVRFQESRLHVTQFMIMINVMIIIVNCAECFSISACKSYISEFQSVVGRLFQTAGPAIGLILSQKLLYVFRMTTTRGIYPLPCGRSLFPTTFSPFPPILSPFSPSMSPPSLSPIPFLPFLPLPLLPSLFPFPSCPLPSPPISLPVEAGVRGPPRKIFEFLQCCT
jgi:hypothetical protein